MTRFDSSLSLSLVCFVFLFWTLSAHDIVDRVTSLNLDMWVWNYRISMHKSQNVSTIWVSYHEFLHKSFTCQSYCFGDVYTKLGFEKKKKPQFGFWWGIWPTTPNLTLIVLEFDNKNLFKNILYIFYLWPKPWVLYQSLCKKVHFFSTLWELWSYQRFFPQCLKI